MKIIIYKNTNCGRCAILEKYLEENKLDFVVRNIEDDGVFGLYNRDKLTKCRKRKNKMNKELPLLVIGNNAYTTNQMFIKTGQPNIDFLKEVFEK